MSDNLSVVVYTIAQAREKGHINYVMMSNDTLNELAMSKDLDKVLEDRGWKQTKPHIIGRDIISFALDVNIIIAEIEGLKINTEKDVEVKFHN